MKQMVELEVLRVRKLAAACAAGPRKRFVPDEKVRPQPRAHLYVGPALILLLLLLLLLLLHHARLRGGVPPRPPQ
jgi:hypothetical protein